MKNRKGYFKFEINGILKGYNYICVNCKMDNNVEYKKKKDYCEWCGQLNEFDITD